MQEKKPKLAYSTGEPSSGLRGVEDDDDDDAMAARARAERLIMPSSVVADGNFYNAAPPKSRKFFDSR